MKEIKRYARPMLIVLLLVLLFTIPAMATSGNVAGAVQQTWKDAAKPWHNCLLQNVSTVDPKISGRAGSMVKLW